MLIWVSPQCWESTLTLRMYGLLKVFVNIVEAQDLQRCTLLIGDILLSILFAGCLSSSQDKSGQYEELESLASKHQKALIATNEQT